MCVRCHRASPAMKNPSEGPRKTGPEPAAPRSPHVPEEGVLQAPQVLFEVSPLTPVEEGQLPEGVLSLLHVAQGHADDVGVGQAGLGGLHGQGEPSLRVGADSPCYGGGVPGAWGGGARRGQCGETLWGRGSGSRKRLTAL